MSISKSLIIGASGQVGQMLKLELGQDRVITTSHVNRPESLPLDLADLHDSSIVTQILREHDIRAVYCVGGATNVDRCEADPLWAMRTNRDGPGRLAALCRDIPFVYFSTEYVFDGSSGPYTEASRPNPINVYGMSKLLGEREVLTNHPHALILRTTVVYGQDSGEKNFLYTLKKSLTSGVRINVAIDQISTPTYNRDLAAASIQLVQNSRSGIINVSGPDIISRYEFAVRCAASLGLDTQLVVGAPTSSLGQKAPRPLNAGLTTDLLHDALPSLYMRPVESALLDFKFGTSNNH